MNDPLVSVLHTDVVTQAVVKFSKVGFHRWPGATGKRAYLAATHRHLFHCQVRLQVFHGDREIEFHDLLDFCESEFPGGNMGDLSCEQMAAGLLEAVLSEYGRDRVASVSVFEDGDVGAIVFYVPNPIDRL